MFYFFVTSRFWHPGDLHAQNVWLVNFTTLLKIEHRRAQNMLTRPWLLGSVFFRTVLPKYLASSLACLWKLITMLSWWGTISWCGWTQQLYWRQEIFVVCEYIVCNWLPLFKYYSGVSGGLRETKAAIWVQGSICYRGYGSVKSTVLFLNFSHIMQLDIYVRAIERITNKKSRMFYSSECFHGRR